MSEPFKIVVYDDGERTVITRLYHTAEGRVRCESEVFIRVKVITEGMPIRYGRGDKRA